MPDSNSTALAFRELSCSGVNFADKYSGTNVDAAIDGDDLLLRIKTTKVIGESANGNSMTASSGGFQDIAVGANKILKVSLNVMPK